MWLFLLPCHFSSHTPPSDDLPPFLEGGCCYSGSLSWLKIVPMSLTSAADRVLKISDLIHLLLLYTLFCPVQLALAGTQHNINRFLKLNFPAVLTTDFVFLLNHAEQSCIKLCSTSFMWQFLFIVGRGRVKKGLDNFTTGRHTAVQIYIFKKV